MKNLKIITFIVITLGLISTIFFLSHNTMRGLLFVIPPYIILFAVMYWLYKKKASDASHIALFIAATVVCSLAAVHYYSVIFATSHSSTEGLVFLSVPVYSIILIGIVYPLAKTLTGIILTKERKVRITVALTTGIAFVYILFSIITSLKDEDDHRRYSKIKLTHSIQEAKKRGVFVKELNYSINNFDGSLRFHPYIEKAFSGGGTSDTKILMNQRYPFRLGFNKFHSGLFIFVRDKELNKFDSVAGSGYCGASGYLRKPELPDTILLGIRRDDSILGTIKVWN